MRDFYVTSSTMPLDQADGLRRLFAGRQPRVLALAANPYVEPVAPVLDRVAASLAQQGRRVLVVDAALSAPQPPELAQLDLGAAVEDIAEGVSYLAARGLPLAYVDTRGGAGRFIEAAQAAAPQADTVLLHAEAAELTRLLAHRPVRPLLLGADHPEAIKHAYAGCKLLATRAGLATFDLLLVARAGSPRLDSIAASLAGCAESFLGALLCDWTVIDPEMPPDDEAAAEALARLLAAQLQLDAEAHPPQPTAGRSSRAVFR